MTNSTDKIETRVDPAHAVDGLGLPEADNPTSDLLKSIAGFSKETTLKQVCGQSIELAAHLQNKQKLLDRRESELNAKLAMLESEARANRVRIDPDSSTDTDASSEAAQIRPFPTGDKKRPLDCGIELVIHQERVARRNQQQKSDGHSSQETSTDHLASDIDYDSMDDGFEQLFDKQPPDPSELVEQSIRQSEIENLQATLVERENRVARREQDVERLHDEVAHLHKESLELRIATEQLWSELGNSLTEEQLAESINGYRTRLINHYKMAADELARRGHELHQRQQDVRNQDMQLRRQRLDVQVWVDQQRDELESNAAELATREAEINRREVEFQRQAITWQKQREEYRRQIEQLSRRVRE